MRNEKQTETEKERKTLFKSKQNIAREKKATIKENRKSIWRNWKQKERETNYDYIEAIKARLKKDNNAERKSWMKRLMTS